MNAVPFQDHVTSPSDTESRRSRTLGGRKPIPPVSRPRARRIQIRQISVSCRPIQRVAPSDGGKDAVHGSRLDVESVQVNSQRESLVGVGLRRQPVDPRAAPRVAPGAGVGSSTRTAGGRGSTWSSPGARQRTPPTAPANSPARTSSGASDLRRTRGLPLRVLGLLSSRGRRPWRAHPGRRTRFAR